VPSRRNLQMRPVDVAASGGPFGVVRGRRLAGPAVLSPPAPASLYEVLAPSAGGVRSCLPVVVRRVRDVSFRGLGARVGVARAADEPGRWVRVTGLYTGTVFFGGDSEPSLSVCSFCLAGVTTSSALLCVTRGVAGSFCLAGVVTCSTFAFGCDLLSAKLVCVTRGVTL
jgi:hypothetical protein